ncbi:hypothetical protein SAMN04487890_102457 [Mucilaginibacter polytrichastri]|nr:hypothetical protein SAMN04487890_102457 [Mucilaginibacter polytrichastri]
MDLSQIGLMFFGLYSRPFATITGGQQVSGTYAFGHLYFGIRTNHAPGVTTKLSILNNGNVGMGSVNPNQKHEALFMQPE